jgi:hypothetical protein
MPVERDENGYWIHPDLSHFWQVEMNGAESCDSVQWEELCERAGIKTETVRLENQERTHPAYIRYFQEGELDISDWDPSPPPGWWLIDIGDSEDGPFAVWATHA